MTELILPALFFIAAGFGAGLWLLRWRERRTAARRRVEEPNSHYSSLGVRQQEDRERWGEIDFDELHPLNREEVRRLLEIVDADGVGVLSIQERLFLDNMTLPRPGS